ncbi:hypothetical protein [Alicyclobacillus sp. SO9]|uniref:hypothetical protein n=1 Tax=Alicyclobacillus sp. SO9 TaxID=2665646 RepID=UPI0018E7889E|nr:hypothetical protein [Alicyclobacillus sp. SO9]QQE77384.1 hypothetical protein GI364_15670 [Alicyclobacillus sp. SO9]
MVYAIAAVVVVLLLVLIWLNVYWARQLPKRDSAKVAKRNSKSDVPTDRNQGASADAKSSVHRHSEQNSGEDAKPDVERGANADMRPDAKPDVERGANADMRPDAKPERYRAQVTRGTDRRFERPATDSELDKAHNVSDGQRDLQFSSSPASPETGSDASANWSSHPSAESEHEQTSIEVLQNRTLNSREGIFAQRRQPYYLNEVNVPDFTRQDWVQSFLYLTNHDGVLGWIAFSQETVGAADRKYDEDFLDALRSYRISTDRLQKQVGLSRVVETSIVGDEGKVWLLTVVDEIWFALFVDRDVDSWALTRDLLQAHANNRHEPS